LPIVESLAGRDEEDDDEERLQDLVKQSRPKKDDPTGD
jgi:hypothetical protein